MEEFPSLCALSYLNECKQEHLWQWSLIPQGLWVHTRERCQIMEKENRSALTLFSSGVPESDFPPFPIPCWSELTLDYSQMFPGTLISSDHNNPCFCAQSVIESLVHWHGFHWYGHWHWGKLHQNHKWTVPGTTSSSGPTHSSEHSYYTNKLVWVEGACPGSVKTASMSAPLNLWLPA